MVNFELNMDVDEDCPLCCDPLAHDLNFFPCQCGFQICSMCWHKIKEADKEPKCPNCRSIYGDEPFQFTPLNEVQKEKLRQLSCRPQAPPKPKPLDVTNPLNREKLSQVRVMQKNLVFVVGLSAAHADEKILRKPQYFGKFGKIMKVAVNQATGYAGVQKYYDFRNSGPSASAYVTYSTTEAALSCIQQINGLWQEGRTLKATLGTTKYCSRFLNGQQCKLTDCMYLHEVADENASFTKEDMQKGKHTEYERKLMDNFRKQQEELKRKNEEERRRQQQMESKRKTTTSVKIVPVASLSNSSSSSTSPDPDKPRAKPDQSTESKRQRPNPKHEHQNQRQLQSVPTSQKKTKSGKSEKSEKVKRRQEKRKPSKDEFDEEEKPEKPVQREEEIPAVWDSSDEELTQQNEPPVTTRTPTPPLRSRSKTPVDRRSPVDSKTPPLSVNTTSANALTVNTSCCSVNTSSISSSSANSISQSETSQSGTSQTRTVQNGTNENNINTSSKSSASPPMSYHITNQRTSLSEEPIRTHLNPNHPPTHLDLTNQKPSKFDPFQALSSQRPPSKSPPTHMHQTMTHPKPLNGHSGPSNQNSQMQSQMPSRTPPGFRTAFDPFEGSLRQSTKPNMVAPGFDQHSDLFLDNLMAPKSISGFAPSNGGVTSSGLPPLLSPTQPFPPQRKPFPPAPPGLKKQDMEMGPPIYGRSFSTQQENFLQSLQNRGFQERNFQNGLPNGTRQMGSNMNGFFDHRQTSMPGKLSDISPSGSGGLPNSLSNEGLGFDPVAEAFNGLKSLQLDQQPEHPNSQFMRNHHHQPPQRHDRFENMSNFYGGGPSEGLLGRSGYNHMMGGPGSAGPPPEMHQKSKMDVSEWQDGLRRLLPNVNVRFAENLQQNGFNRPPPTQQNDIFNRNQFQNSSIGVGGPPPGFGGPSGFEQTQENGCFLPPGLLD